MGNAPVLDILSQYINALARNTASGAPMPTDDPGAAANAPQAGAMPQEVPTGASMAASGQGPVAQPPGPMTSGAGQPQDMLQPGINPPNSAGPVPNAAPMDFGGVASEPAMPAQGMEVNGPPAQIQPMAPRSLLPPEAVTNAITSDNTQRLGVDRSNAANMEAAQRELADTQQAVAQANQPVLDKAAQMELEAHDALKAFNQLATQRMMEDEARVKGILEEQKKILAENPRDFWGNATTERRVGAVIGMLGAGMQQESMAGYLDGIIAKDVADQARRVQGTNLRLEGEERLQKLHHFQGVDYEHTYNLLKASRHDAVAAMMQAQMNRTASPLVKANLEVQIAKQHQDASALEQKVLQDTHVQWLKGTDQAIDLYKAQTEREKVQLESDPNSNANSNHVAEYTGGIPKNLAPNIVDRHVNLITAIDALGALASNAQKGLSFAGAQRAAKLDALVDGPLRKVIGTGANLTDNEKKNMDALKSSYKDWVADKISGADFVEQVNLVQRGLANQAHQQMVSVSPGTKLRSGNTLYNVLKGEDDERQAVAHDQVKLDAVLNNPRMSERARKLAIQALSKTGNIAAKRFLERDERPRMDAAGEIAKEVGNLLPDYTD